MKQIREDLSKLEEMHGVPQAARISHQCMLRAISETENFWNRDEPTRYEAKVIKLYGQYLNEATNEIQ